jgi:hypothetical protein
VESPLSTVNLQPIPARGRWMLPAEDKRYASDLLNQQMWCWGSDIRRPEGNLLHQYGFVKHRAPDGSGLKPCYTFTAHDGLTIGLWGFGVYFADGHGQGLFLKRFDFSPRLISAAEMRFDVWVTRDLPELTTPRSGNDLHISGRLVCGALQWVASYERWVLQQAGPEYRTATTEAWRGLRKRVAVDGPQMADAWQKLAQRCGLPQPGTCTLNGD